MLSIFRALIAVFLLAMGAQTAHAHPHVWITAKADILLDEDNNITAIRHQWTFDDAFAAFATVGLDENNDGKLSREELAELATVNVESVSQFEYFTFIQMGPDDPEYAKPTEYWLEEKDGVLTLFYTLPMAEPIKPDPKTGFEQLTIEVFDATFFVAVDFDETDPITLYGPNDTPSACQASLQRPVELDPIQSQLLADIGPTETVPDDLAEEVGSLSNTIRLTCPTS